jgi:hypothetical protein
MLRIVVVQQHFSAYSQRAYKRIRPGNDVYNLSDDNIYWDKKYDKR